MIIKDEVMAAPGPATKPPISEDFDRVQNSLYALGELIHELTNRLVPVLNDGDPLAEQETVPLPGGSPVAKRLQEFDHVVTKLSGEVETLLDRLEV